MRGLLSLAGKEWRDVRAVTAASAVLVVLACLGVRWFLEERYGLSYADFPSMPRFLDVFVPGCAALYATLIAADTVGGEVASRRIDLTALLPAGRTRVWAAKAGFLVAASALFTLWCAVVQWGVLASIDGAQFAEPFVTRALGSRWVLGLVATFAGATLLVSTVGLRGLAAALVGGAVALGLWGGTYEFMGILGYQSSPYGPYDASWFEGQPRETIAALWLPPVLLAAAALAYSGGRVHLGKLLRPAVISAAVLVAALGAPGAVLAYDAWSVVPGARGVYWSQAWPSPDGRFVALPHRKDRPALAEKVFVLDVERGVLVEPECGNCGVDVTPGTWDGVWDADGSLLATSIGVGGVTLHRVDPATGTVRSSESMDLAAYGDRERRRFAAWNASIRWRVVENRRADDGGPTFRVTLPDTQSQERREFRSWAPASIPFPYRRIVYFPEPCVLAVRELPDGKERRLLTSSDPWKGGRDEIGDVSHDGCQLLVRHDGVWKALDLETGSTRDLPPGATKPRWWQVLGDPSRRTVVLSEGRAPAPSEVLDLVTGALGRGPGQYPGEAYAISGGRLVVRHGEALDLVERDLRIVRRLWPLAKE